MGNNNKKIQDYKTFEELKFKTSKDIYNWSGKTPKHYGVEVEASNIIVSKIKNTPSLNWLNDRGYGVVVVEGEKRKGTLDNIGQTGVPYTFFLIPSWNKEDYINYIEDNFGSDKDEISNIFNILNMDVDSLEIYGKPKSAEYNVRLNNEEIDFHYILDFYEENKENWDDVKIEVSLIDDGSDLSGNNFYDYPFWGAKVPLRFDSFPNEGSNKYNVLCEYGLTMVKWEISKYLKATDNNKYSELVRRSGFDNDIIYTDTDILIKYMNLSNVHVTKNEDIIIARGVGYNMYQGSKLFEQNHSNARFSVSPGFVSEFLKESGTMNIPNFK